MKNESNLVIKIVAIICIIAVIGIVIINVFKPKWFEEKVKPVDSNVNTLDSEQLKNVDYFLTLIKGYNLDYLDQENKSNISNFTNLTNKTKWLLGTYNLLEIDKIKLATITEKLKTIFGTSINFQPQNLVDETSNEIIYSYNETEKEFVVNPDFDQSVFDTPVVSINHKLVNYNYENNQYIITINKLFYVLENDRISNDFYGSYTDAVSRTNVIFSYQSDEDITNEELIDYATNYYNNNYSDLFTKLKQYQYIFIKNNNDYILKEYIIR